MQRCFCLLLAVLCLLAGGNDADAAPPDFWYDGQRKVKLHAQPQSQQPVPGRERRYLNPPGGSSRKNDGHFYICYPPEWSTSQILALEASYQLKKSSRHLNLPAVRMYQHDNAEQALTLANRIFEENDLPCAAPLWKKQVAVKSLATGYDPLFPQQWYLYDTAQCGDPLLQGLSAPAAWSFSLGEGITIAVVDDGLAFDHPDLVDNLLAGGHFDFVSIDGSLYQGDHGTSVAGIAAGRGFNHIGLMGVAPSASLLSLRILSETDNLVDEADEAAALHYNAVNVDIYNNSWGPPDGSSYAFEGPSVLTRSAIEAGIHDGRNGLGSIYVWAAGNGGRGDDSNLDGYANSRFSIAVTATACSGIAASYAEPGSNILVNAPSNDGHLGMVATDLLGFSGYNAGLTSQDLSDADYTNTFGGTSGATATVSGVVALMLAKNAQLNWREVHQILAFSADKNDPSDPLWRTNGAGFPVNEKYGYGRVNAWQAVNMAARWAGPISEEQSVLYSRRVNRAIPDADPQGVTDTIAVGELLRVENVMVTVDIPDHEYWGDLSMFLTSPQGTRVRLVRENYISSNALSLGYDQWTFKDALHLGELSAGNWSLEVIDNFDGQTGTLNSWSMQIFGALVPTTAEQLPVACAAHSASRPEVTLEQAVFMGVNQHGAAYGREVTGHDRVDYSVLAAVRPGFAISEQLAVARYDNPDGSRSWLTLTDDGWQPWDEQIMSLRGFSFPSGQLKVVHAGKLGQGRYALWNGFRDHAGEVFYCYDPLFINVEE